jgi:hypothetical protein
MREGLFVLFNRVNSFVKSRGKIIKQIYGNKFGLNLSFLETLHTSTQISCIFHGNVLIETLSKSKLRFV